MLPHIVLIRANFWDLMTQMSLFAIIIIAILLSMSLISWGIMLNKWKLFHKVSTDNRRFLQAFRRANNLHDARSSLLAFKNAPLAVVFDAGYRAFADLMQSRTTDVEVGNGTIVVDDSELQEIDRVLQRQSSEEIGDLERRVSFLATTGNVAPFFGLLGTCWGIMYAFLDIGAQGSASLIVVAPGIAEALVATIFGLAVAIPAVIGFNWCNTKLKSLADEMDNFSIELLSALVRK